MDTKRIGINTVCADMDMKETVKITNGIEDGGVFTPTEAIALRVVGILPNGDPKIAFTYRKVNPAALVPLADTAFPDLRAVRPSRFAGRI